MYRVSIANACLKEAFKAADQVLFASVLTDHAVNLWENARLRKSDFPLRLPFPLEATPAGKTYATCPLVHPGGWVAKQSGSQKKPMIHDQTQQPARLPSGQPDSPTALQPRTQVSDVMEVR